eukprot:Skav209176  [mRNA]  locus=scaffold1137:464808:467215:- [translate_table: standard]
MEDERALAEANDVQRVQFLEARLDRQLRCQCHHGSRCGHDPTAWATSRMAQTPTMARHSERDGPWKPGAMKKPLQPISAWPGLIPRRPWLRRSGQAVCPNSSSHWCSSEGCGVDPSRCN